MDRFPSSLSFLLYFERLYFKGGWRKVFSYGLLCFAQLKNFTLVRQDNHCFTFALKLPNPNCNLALVKEQQKRRQTFDYKNVVVLQLAGIKDI